jgi:hypothetical protein
MTFSDIIRDEPSYWSAYEDYWNECIMGRPKSALATRSSMIYHALQRKKAHV